MSWEKLRPGIAPAYLFLCLIAGGSTQGVWANAVLQLLGVAIIAWAALAWRSPDGLMDRRGGGRLFGLVGLTLLLFLVQLVPLPPARWTSLPGRELVADGFGLLDVAPGWMPVSLAPYDTLASLMTLLPPIAVLAAMVGLRAYTSAGMAIAVVAAAVAGVLLGALQVTSPDPQASSWYLYPITNFGVAVGFFANANHMATLLLIAIPMVTALAASAQDAGTDVRLRWAAMVVGIGSLLLLLLGLALNGSLAGYGLAGPVLLASSLMIVGPRHRRARLAILLGGLACFLAFILIIFTPLNERLVAEDSAASVSTRQEMLATSAEAVRQFGFIGSGIGTFRKVHSLFEDPDRVDLTFVNHAHNDYVELVLEGGLPGAVLLALFLGWWVMAVGSMARSPAADRYAMAAAIGSAAILVHSSVDFPLRTAGISAAFAACLALIILSRRPARSENDLRPTRHVVIG